MDVPWQYQAPWGHRLLDYLFGGNKGLSLRANRMIVLVLTFLSYAAYHASRKPPSIVKSVLHGNAEGDDDGIGYRMTMTHESIQHRGQYYGLNGTSVAAAAAADGSHHHHHPIHTDSGWSPFNNPSTGKALLGDLDLAFLGTYALGMFVSGHLGDRLDLRHFLTIGMLGSGAAVAAFGAGYFWQIHSLPYYIAVQMAGGLFQATGWPSVVSVMANWYGKGNRGLIMGLWNAHTSIGNIVGTLIAAYMLKWGWGWSFVVPGAVIASLGLIIWSFLVVEPQDIGFLPNGTAASELLLEHAEGATTPGSLAGSDMSADTREILDRRLQRLMAQRNGGGGGGGNSMAARQAAHHTVHPPHGRHGLYTVGSTLVLMDDGGLTDSDSLVGGSPRSVATTTVRRRKAGVSFVTALAIPGVAVYAFTLFFAKLVAYTFLYWLPYYINATEVGGETLSPTKAGNLSILFDVGGVMGGVVAGYLSDCTRASALVSTGFVYTAIPFLYAYRAYGSISFPINIALMTTAGFFVNGPYALITTAVSADLGTHGSLAGNEKALATVTAIIDGMGSIGAAIGPVATGYISELPGGFDNVFYMLYGAAACAGLLLSKLAFREAKEMWTIRRNGGGFQLPGEQFEEEDRFALLPQGVARSENNNTMF